MPGFPLLAALAVACLLTAGCHSRSGNSAGSGFSPGAEATPGSRVAALVLSATDDVTWQDPADGKWHRLETGAELPEGAVVKSAGESGAELRLPGEAGVVTLNPRTRITLARLDDEESMEIWVTDGRVDGELKAGTLRLRNSCGGFLALTPRQGFTAPFSFGNTIPDELWETVLGLGMEPGVTQSTLSDRAALDQVSQVFIAPVRTPIAIPEPSPVALALIGGIMVTGVLRWRRAGS